MSRKLLIASGVIIAALLFALLTAGTVVSQEIMDVIVTNWPPVQEVEGEVRVRGPIKSATTVRIEDIIVSPVKRNQTTRLIEAGTLVTDGYPYLVLSVAGQVKGEVVRPATVGAILIPDEETVLTALNEEGQFMFPLEIKSAEVGQSSPYFDSEQIRFVVGFPRYKVLLYNTGEKTVEVDLFAYLTN